VLWIFAGEDDAKRMLNTDTIANAIVMHMHVYYVDPHVYMHARARARMYVCIYIYTYIYIYIYIYMICTINYVTLHLTFWRANTRARLLGVY